jgi:hypothetical protein
MKNQRGAIVVWKWKGAFADALHGLSVVERKQMIINRGSSGEPEVGGVGIQMKESRSLS